MKFLGARADTWYKYAKHAMTARPNTSSSAFAGSGRYEFAFFTYRAWRFS